MDAASEGSKKLSVSIPWPSNFPRGRASFENPLVEALRERRVEGFFGRNMRQPCNKMVEAALADLVKA
jgi:hypothetical protein